MAKKTPKPLPSEAGLQAVTPQPDVEVAQENTQVIADAFQVEPTPPPAPVKELTPLEALVQGIQTRRALVAKQPSDFPASTRSGLVLAQGEAKDTLVLLEREYAAYLNSAAVACVILAQTPALEKAFVEKALECTRPLVVIDASALYQRLATVGTQGLGDTRQFGSGQVGLIIEELAAIGKELYFTSLAAPNWQYDEVVPTFQDFVAVIRKAIRTSKDGDILNRAFLRMEAFKSALDLGYTKAMVPIMVIGGTLGEREFLANNLFSASVTVTVNSEADVTEEKVSKALKTMRNVGHPTQLSN